METVMLYPLLRKEHTEPYSGEPGLYSIPTRVGNGQQPVVVKKLLFGKRVIFTVIKVPRGHVLSPYLAGTTPLMVSLEGDYPFGSAKAVIQGYLKRKLEVVRRSTDSTSDAPHREEVRA